MLDIKLKILSMQVQTTYHPGSVTGLSKLTRILATDLRMGGRPRLESEITSLRISSSDDGSIMVVMILMIS